MFDAIKDEATIAGVAVLAFLAMNPAQRQKYAKYGAGALVLWYLNNKANERKALNALKSSPHGMEARPSKPDLKTVQDSIKAQTAAKK